MNTDLPKCTDFSKAIIALKNVAIKHSPID